MKVAIYARVSSPIPKNATPEQIKDIQRQDTENQLHPLIEYCKSMEWNVYNNYVENESAAKTRPVLNQMMLDARQRKFDLVLVWKLDRFARSVPDFYRLIEELSRSKVRFKVLTQPIDTDIQTPEGQLLMNILASFAQFERQLTISRINASIARRRAQGLPVGRERVIANIDEIVRLAGEGMSIRKIAKLLKIKRGTVENRLKERGFVRNETIVVIENWPILIEDNEEIEIE